MFSFPLNPTSAKVQLIAIIDPLISIPRRFVSDRVRDPICPVTFARTADFFEISTARLVSRG